MEIIIDNIKYETTQLENGKWTLPEEIKKCLKSCCGALDIDGNRVGTEKRTQFSGRSNAGSNTYFEYNQDNAKTVEVEGRYPSQTFCDSNTAEVLDRQSGISKSSKLEPHHKTTTADWGNGETLTQTNKSHGGDTGGCSKILHKCDFEENEHDLYFYNPKVSKSERNAGCDGEEKQYSHDGRNKEIENPYQRNKSVAINNHPTLKPIKLNERILKLFKTPNEQKIIYPFAGSGSEVIGGIKAGFKNWVGCEINPDYVEIAKARIEYWTTQDEQVTIFDIEKVGKNESKF